MEVNIRGKIKEVDSQVALVKLSEEGEFLSNLSVIGSAAEDSEISYRLNCSRRDDSMWELMGQLTGRH